MSDQSWGCRGRLVSRIRGVCRGHRSATVQVVNIPSRARGVDKTLDVSKGDLGEQSPRHQFTY